MELMRAGSQLSTRGSADCFTGTVRTDPLHAPPLPPRVEHVTDAEYQVGSPKA